MNTLVRILFATAAIGLLVGGGWLAVALVQTARLQRQVADLERQVKEEQEHRKRVMERLSRARRLGRLEVVKQHRAGDPAAQPLSPSAAAELQPQEVVTTVEFIELDESGREIGRRRATVPGRTVFLDAWTVRFPGEGVAEADPLRGRSIALLRRIYSDRLAPADGIAIDTPGAVPDGYAASEGARFERALWKRFWSLATDPDAAAEQGVRVAQGEAVYKPVAAGQRYEVELENAGGLLLRPMP